MADFKENLDKEIEKRQEDTSAVKKTKTEKKKKFKKFSFFTFLMTSLILFSALAVLMIWAAVNGDKTIENLGKNLPSKTAIIQAATSPPNTTHISLGGNKTTPPQIKKDAAKPIPTDETPKITPEKSDSAYKIEQSTFQAQTKKPLLSFVITDLGLAEKKTANIIQNFSSEVSLSFSPYSKDLQSLIDKAKADGHEVWITLPLETKDYPLNDTGPLTLLVNASTEKNSYRLNEITKNTASYAGFTTAENHIFKSEDAKVNPVIEEIFKKGFSIIDGGLSLKSFLKPIADKRDYPYAKNDIWLDSDLSPEGINKKIEKIKDYGMANKNTIVMLRPYPASLKAIQKFMNSPAADKFEMAPVSAQLKNK